MSRRSRDRYRDLLDVLLQGLKSPPGAAYLRGEGERARTFFRPVECNRENILAGWEMVVMLRRHGHRAYEVCTPIPRGEVTFVDERQIVVRERVSRREGGVWNGDRATIRRPGLRPEVLGVWC